MGKRHLMAVGIVFVLAIVIATAQEPIVLEGAWRIESITSEGQTQTSDRGYELVLTFRGNTYTQAVNGIVNERGTVNLDLTQKPIRVDFVATDDFGPSVTQFGVIEIDGRTLRLHITRGSAPRPTDFNPLPDNFLIVARRN